MRDVQEQGTSTVSYISAARSWWPVVVGTLHGFAGLVEDGPERHVHRQAARVFQGR